MIYYSILYYIILYNTIFSYNMGVRIRGGRQLSGRGALGINLYIIMCIYIYIYICI